MVISPWSKRRIDALTILRVRQVISGVIHLIIMKSQLRTYWGHPRTQSYCSSNTSECACMFMWMQIPLVSMLAIIHRVYTLKKMYRKCDLRMDFFGFTNHKYVGHWRCSIFIIFLFYIQKKSKCRSLKCVKPIAVSILMPKYPINTVRNNFASRFGTLWSSWGRLIVRKNVLLWQNVHPRTSNDALVWHGSCSIGMHFCTFVSYGPQLGLLFTFGSEISKGCILHASRAVGGSSMHLFSRQVHELRLEFMWNIVTIFSSSSTSSL